ncbi:peptide methionine sulfoxide reductase MsrA-like isoform X2 [Mercenaria mercenaria]|uniref:peptide methionine sulfoxide reductase MsrA-like isoform X2 n=1 Tax=Mercenaria mercenaria TaxID=6596 RepID=UPI00234F0C6A|nr:peptide methionine sulfoxide reductase MsrA-like isoform X2 [Mercenaria mercenaria]
MSTSKLLTMPRPEDALPGREEKMAVAPIHVVNGNPTLLPFPERTQMAMFGMGCFWGVERLFWSQPGVYSTQVGYSSGFSSNPTYEEVSTGRTGHAEVVRIFWENHDPTQENRQGRSQGTQYRSGIYYYSNDQKTKAEASKDTYDRLLQSEGHGKVVTEIKPVSEFYYAEDYHQQYLHKNPGGYCGLKGTGISCS